MARRIPLTVGFVVFLAVVASGCSGPTRPSENKVVPYSGTVPPGGVGQTHSFDVPNIGEFSVKLTAFSPGNVYIDFVWGQMAGGSCSVIVQNNPTITSSFVGRTILSGSVITKGQYCVVALDPYNIIGSAVWPVAQTYTIEVSHP
jgi:hypothetical protein